MIQFLAHLVVTAGLLLLVANLVEGIEIEGWGPALLGALVLGLANACVHPLMILFTLPLTALTFGLFLLVVNGVMLQITAALTPGVKVDGCGSAIIGSIILSLLNVGIAIVLESMSATGPV
jgi:putative membrane protein